MKQVSCWVFGVVLVLCVGLAVGSAQEAISASTIAQGPESGIRIPTNVVVRTEADWRALWRKHMTGLPQAQTVPPRVDFFQDMVIAVFAGEVPLGSRFGILRVTAQQGRLIVLIRQLGSPGPEPGGGPPITPFHIIRVARSLLPVVFVRPKLPQPIGPGN